MRRRIPIKNHTQEIQLVTQRAIVALVVMIICIGLLITRLAYLQLRQHDLYTTLSKKNSLDLVPSEPTRGLIYDRNGILLAENIPVFSLDIIPDKIDNFPQTLADIAKIIPLTDMEVAQFQKQLKQHRRFDEIPLKMRLTEEEVAKFAENQFRFPGVTIKARLMRHYLYGSTLAHILGYVGRINAQELNEIDTTNYSATHYIGKLGIEKYYEDELHGKVGYEQIENDASGQMIRSLNRINPVGGENLYLTIDINLQLIAEQALKGHRGAVVAIQPATGQILALVSEPSFDPNIFVAGISNQDFQNLQQSPDRPLYNRAIRGLYPLASTIKPFLALQGLETGVISPTSTIFDPGWFKLKNSEHIFHDYWHPGHGIVNITRAIVKSCDTYFYDMAAKLGIQRIDDILHQFGFGELTGVDNAEESSGVVASPAWKRKIKGMPWYEGDTIISGIGQGFMQATPLQLASGVATLASQGKRMTPYFLLGEQSTSKGYIQEQPLPQNTIKINSAYWDIVIDAMQKVISSPEGTGYQFGKNASYSIAAKTGTAQVHSKKYNSNGEEMEQEKNLPEHLRNHSLLIAFAPVINPKIAVAVIVENSSQAGMVARTVLDAYLISKSNLPLRDINHETS